MVNSEHMRRDSFLLQKRNYLSFTFFSAVNKDCFIKRKNIEVFWLVFFCFLGQVPRLGVELELPLLAYFTATAMPYPSCV